MTWQIYKLMDPRDRTIFYIGITEVGPAERLRQHRSSPDSAAFNRIRELRDLGLETAIEVIASAENKASAVDFEAYLISRTPGLLNRSAPYGKHPDRVPTANPKWPALSATELKYTPDDEQIRDEAQMVKAIAKLLPGIEEWVISQVVHAQVWLLDADYEHQGETDE